MTDWELLTRVLAITGAVSIAMRPLMIPMIGHTSWTERRAERRRREDQARWERTRQPDGREGCGRRMRMGVDGAVLVQVRCDQGVTPAPWHRSRLKSTGDDAPRAWTPKEIP